MAVKIVDICTCKGGSELGPSLYTSGITQIFIPANVLRLYTEFTALQNELRDNTEC
jgi:hypothetical protein